MIPKNCILTYLRSCTKTVGRLSTSRGFRSSGSSGWSPVWLSVMFTGGCGTSMMFTGGRGTMVFTGGRGSITVGSELGKGGVCLHLPPGHKTGIYHSPVSTLTTAYSYSCWLSKFHHTVLKILLHTSENMSICWFILYFKKPS